MSLFPNRFMFVAALVLAAAGARAEPRGTVTQNPGPALGGLIIGCLIGCSPDWSIPRGRDKVTPWIGGIGADGETRIAARNLRIKPGDFLYYYCKPSGMSLLAIFGKRIPSRRVRFVLEDGRKRAFWFERRGNALVYEMPPGSDMLRFLGSGKNLNVHAGSRSWREDMPGALEALEGTRKGCFG